MVFKPSLNITEQIADHLANLVIHGQLGGGARIQELKIANELGVSRGSVREALLILERRHLIEIVPRKGAVVNDISAHEARELVDMLASIERRWLHSLIREAGAADSLKIAGEILLTMDRAARADSIEEMVQARGEFYGALLVSASRYMNGVFECLLPTSQRLMRTLVERANIELHDIARYYRALHGALEVADGDRVDELLSAFRKRWHQLCLKSISSSSKPRVNQCANSNMPVSANSI